MQVSIPGTGEVISADPALEPERFQEQICELLGLPATIPTAKAIEQLVGGLVPVTPENEEKINFFLAFVVAHKPKSLLEAQLLVQLLASHKLCTRMLQKAHKETWPENIDKYVNIAMKLSRGFKSGLEALAKYRRDGKQYLFIERVTVEKDGQALFGNVERG